MAKFTKKVAEQLAAKVFKQHQDAPFAYVTEDKQVFVDATAYNNYKVNSKLKSYRIKNPDIEVAKSEVEQLEEELKAARTEADNAQEELQQKQNEIEELKAELNEATELIDKLEGQTKTKK